MNQRYLIGYHGEDREKRKQFLLQPQKQYEEIIKLLEEDIQSLYKQFESDELLNSANLTEKVIDIRAQIKALKRLKYLIPTNQED